MLFQQSIYKTSFKRWIMEEEENRLMLIVSISAIVVQFLVFKFLYPYPNFMPPDSDSYVDTAYNNQFINLWPIGYSKFLRLVSCFTSSHTVLVWFQYLLLQGCLLYFLFSIRYFLSPGKWLFRVIMAISLLNPLLPHISNYVSSDSLFTALSLLWFTQLLWIICRPSLKLMVWHAVILLLAFSVRYTAVFYPCISVAAILITNTGLRNKFVGIAGILLLLGSFIICTVWYYHRETGTLQYSAFGGWLVGSSALYGYAYANPDPVESVPARFRALHQLVNNHMDSIRHLRLRPDAEVSIYYFWDWKAPLMVYMNNKWSKDTKTGILTRWASVSTLYADYGRYLILRHPWLFLRHYAWPNFIKYYAPPPKFMGGYNMGSENVAPVIANWFQWKNTKVHSRYNNKEIHITKVFTVLSAIVNLLFIVCFIGFVWLGGIRRCEFTSRRILYWTLVVWFGNMFFSVVSAPIELRYQLFPLMITTVLLCLLLCPFIMAGIYPQDPKWNTFFNLKTEPKLIQAH